MNITLTGSIDNLNRVKVILLKLIYWDIHYASTKFIKSWDKGGAKDQVDTRLVTNNEPLDLEPPLVTG